MDDPLRLRLLTGYRPRGSLRARIERALSPGLSSCYRCGRPWRTNAQRRTGLNSWQGLNRLRYYGLVGVDSHVTSYSPTSGCFPLCEGCWSALAPEQRATYYDLLVDEWIRQSPADALEYEAKRQKIQKAVAAGA